MLNTLLLSMQVDPAKVAEASKSLIDYGIVGAILFLALAGIVFMYITNNKREKERHETHRADMAAVADANRKERERWQELDNERFKALQEISTVHAEASLKNAVALEQLGMIIKERIR